jgi:hypothetical protein
MARRVNLSGAPDVVAGASGEELARHVATVLFSLVPTWTPPSDLDFRAPSGHSLRELLRAATELTVQAGFAYAPSVTPDRSAQRPPSPAVDPRVVVLSPTPIRPEDAPPRVPRPLETPVGGTRSASHWTLPSTASLRGPSAPASADQRLAIDLELRDPIWSSWTLPTRDIFSPADAAILAGLPQLYLAKKEASFDSSRRALKDLCTWLQRVHEKSATEIRIALTTLVARPSVHDGFGLDAATALHAALLAIAEGSALGHEARSAAWWQISLAWLRAHPDHHPRVQRLQLAALAVPPTSEKEVSEWLVAKRPIPVDASVGLPVRPSGGF